jgi:hypothetical protein
MITCLVGALHDGFQIIQVYPDFDPLTVLKFLALAAIMGGAGIVAALRGNRFPALVCGIIAVVPALAYIAWLGYLVCSLEQWQDGNSMCLVASVVTLIAGGLAVWLAFLAPQRPRCEVQRRIRE